MTASTMNATAAAATNQPATRPSSLGAVGAAGEPIYRRIMPRWGRTGFPLVRPGPPSSGTRKRPKEPQVPPVSRVADTSTSVPGRFGSRAPSSRTYDRVAALPRLGTYPRVSPKICRFWGCRPPSVHKPGRQSQGGAGGSTRRTQKPAAGSTSSGTSRTAPTFAGSPTSRRVKVAVSGSSRRS
jgi:hypothetical protein